jgi:hypothetical protein
MSCERQPLDAARLWPFGNFGAFVLAKHSSARPVDQVNTSADVARHDFTSVIRGLNAGVALHANARIGAAIQAVQEGRHIKGITTAACLFGRWRGASNCCEVPSCPKFSTALPEFTYWDLSRTRKLMTKSSSTSALIAFVACIPSE